MLLVIRWCVVFFLYAFSVSGLASPSVDLNTVRQDQNLVLSMQYMLTPYDEGLSVLGAMRQSDWHSVSDAPDVLKSPRTASTIWLRIMVNNPTDQVLVRWLEVAPWRLNQVDAWLVADSPLRVVERVALGTDTPLTQRAIQNTRLLVPVSLVPHEKLELILRIHSDSRPFVKITSWNPSHFSAAETHRFFVHAITLAVVATLVLVLFLQMNLRFILLGLWLCITFAFEAEKEGYFSFLLLNGSYDYGSNLRFSTAVWTKALFVCVSIYLLALEYHPIWRRVLRAVCVVALAYSALTWILSDNQLRILASGVNAAALMLWPLMIPAAIKRSRPWQVTILFLLGIAWFTSAFYSFSYIFNLHYTAVFVAERLFIEVAVILGLVLVYARQKRDYDLAIERQLRIRERAELNRLERAVVERTQELNQALETAQEALQAKSRFLGQVTHDLKSPLTTIMGYAQLLRVESGNVGHMSGVIYNSASHMLNMVNRLIGYARGVIKAPVVPVDVYLTAFLDNVQHEAEMLAQRKHNQFELICDPDVPPVVQFDDTFVREILLNLLENSSKFTENGRILLHVSCSGALSDPSLLQFQVKDTGCGIAPDEQKRIFDPFYRLESHTEGIGLGLPIVRELAGKLGGDVTLSSVLGQGTTITLTIPLVPGHEHGDNALVVLPRHKLPDLNAQGKTVWVVEDADTLRQLLQAELESQGFQVTVYEDAESFIQAFSDAPGMPDVVMTDYHLPGANAETVLHTVRQRSSHLPVILLSAAWTHSLECVSPHSDTSFSACLGKPIDLVLLRRELARVCGLSLIVPEPSDTVVSSDDHAQSSFVSKDNPDLTALDLSLLRQWIEQGAMTDILEWCEQKMAVTPASEAVVATIKSYVRRGNFIQLSQFLDRYEP